MKTPNVSLSLGKKIRMYRILCNIQAKELSKMLGIDYQQYHRYETDKVRIPADTLYKVYSYINETLKQQQKAPIDLINFFEATI